MQIGMPSSQSMSVNMAATGTQPELKKSNTTGAPSQKFMSAKAYLLSKTMKKKVPPPQSNS